MYGLIQLPLVALRATAAETAELESQLLYGETVKIIETTDRWLLVENAADGARGWVDRKTLTPISEEQYSDLSTNYAFKVYYPFADCRDYKTEERLLLAGGSIIHDLDKISLLGSAAEFNIDPIQILFVGDATGEKIVELALKYLNAPYLWGGKSVFGIDCSGLVQVVFSTLGVQLPRNASNQAKMGENIYFLTDAQAGDLAFFGKEDGKISHVGILLDNEHIIHASGWVKIEKIDAQGIISGITSMHTHALKAIKRIPIVISD